MTHSGEVGNIDYGNNICARLRIPFHHLPMLCFLSELLNKEGNNLTVSTPLLWCPGRPCHFCQEMSHPEIWRMWGRQWHCKGQRGPTHVGVSSRSAPGSPLAWWVQGGFGSSVVMAAAAPDLWSWGGVKVWCQRHQVVAWLSCLQPVKDFLSTDLCVKSILPKVPRVVFLYWTLMIKCHYVGKK